MADRRAGMVERTADGHGDRRPSRGLAVVVVWVIVLGAAVLGTVSATTPPAPRGAHAPPGEFSAARAMTHLKVLAAAPRPTGSAGAARSQGYLIQQLTQLGLRPSVVSSVECRHDEGELVCGRVSNVYAVQPGTDSRRTVLLVAHYDSVTSGPGAGDNAASVAALLEVLRALRDSAPLPSDVAVLFTEGEEDGLLGSRAAVRSGMLPSPASTVVLNFDARGIGGRVNVIETGQAGGRPTGRPTEGGPFASSSAPAVYALLGNSTDFTVLDDAGYPGLNLAFFSGSAHYHTATDRVASLDQSTLQDVGQSALVLTRRLAPDLGAAGRAGTYFPALGLEVAYPTWFASVLAGLTAVLLLWAVVAARRSGSADLRKVGLSSLATTLSLVAAAAIGWAAWPILIALQPHYVGFTQGDPYDASPARVALAVLAAAAPVVAWYLAGRAANRSERLLGVVVVVGAVGLVASVLVPSAAYLFVVPSLVGVVVTLLTLRWPDGAPSLAAGSLVAGVSLVVLLPVVILIGPALGVALALPMTTVTAATSAMVVAALPRPDRLRGPVVTAVAGAVVVVASAALVVTTVRDEPTRDEPAQVSLVYAVDETSGTGYWLSPYPVPNRVVDRALAEPTDERPDLFPSLDADTDYRWAAAPAADVPRPVVRVLADKTTSDGRLLRVSVSSAGAGASHLAVHVAAQDQLVSARVGDQAVPVDGTTRSPWTWGLTFAGPTEEGVVAELRLDGDGPVRLRATARTPGVPEDALDAPIPDDLTGAADPALFTLAAIEEEL